MRTADFVRIKEVDGSVWDLHLDPRSLYCISTPTTLGLVKLYRDDITKENREDQESWTVLGNRESVDEEINAALTYGEADATPTHGEKTMIEAVKNCLTKNQNTLLIGLGIVIVDHFLLKGRYQKKIKQTLINLLTEEEGEVKKEG